MEYRFKRRGSNELKATHMNILQMLVERYPSVAVVKQTHLTVLLDHNLVKLHNSQGNNTVVSITDDGLAYMGHDPIDFQGH